MEIIGHTAEINKNANALQHYLIANPCRKVEMDFVLTKDNKLMWTHDNIVDRKIVNRSSYNEVKELLTLEEVLEILSGDINLLLHVKSFNGAKLKNVERLIRALEILKDYPGLCQIQSYNAELIRQLLKFDKELNFAEIGLVINYFSTFKYRKGKIAGLENVGFVSLASELWEKGKVGDDYKRYRELFPEAKEYAWTWDRFYAENDVRIKNYMAKKADGIITSEPALVRALYR